MSKIAEIILVFILCYDKHSISQRSKYFSLVDSRGFPLVNLRQGLVHFQKKQKPEQFHKNEGYFTVGNGTNNLFWARNGNGAESRSEYLNHRKRDVEIISEDRRLVNSAERTGSGEEDSVESLCHSPISIRKIERLNKTRTSENGKIYLLTKIVKSRRCARRVPKNSELRRRTFSIMPNLLPIIPWMTKNEATESEIGKNSRENKNLKHVDDTQGHSKVQTELENPNQGLSSSYNAEKLKKVLNLFTIVQFDNGYCSSNGLKGTCLYQTECLAKGGKPIGTCAKGFGVCCYVERTCGQESRENCTYFVNEGFPKPSTIVPKICTLVVTKAHPEVEQLRIEFVVFELRGPSNGTCISDRFTITGHNTNHIIPDICGINNQQHVYVDVDDSNGPYNLNVITMGTDLPRTFQLKITQIKRSDELFAPKNCLQYYTEPTGVVQSFNYQYNDLGNPPQAVPGYFNNLNYAICFKRRPGFCSITYENEDRETTNNDPTFQMLNTDSDGERLLPPNQGGAELFDCPDDYIIVNGLRLCGEKLNDASIDSDLTKDFPVTDYSNGPGILQIRTNNAVTGRGFYLKYRQNPCLQMIVKEKLLVNSDHPPMMLVISKKVKLFGTTIKIHIRPKQKRCILLNMKPLKIKNINIIFTKIYFEHS